MQKNWGYAVQIILKNNRQYLNELFDKEGNIKYELGIFESDSGEVYRTVTEEKEFTKSSKRTIVYESSVRLRELDNNHFIIPRTNESGFGNVLFYVDEDNNVTHKGFIKGKISGNILTENKRLLEEKQLLVSVLIDGTIGLYESFFYSWEKNCRTSDKWNLLFSSKSALYIHDFFLNQMDDLPRELENEIIEYMNAKEAWLAVLKIVSQDKKHHRYFISLIGLNGLPLMDLIYITPSFEVKIHQLKKDSIGEIDNIKKRLEESMNQQLFKIEENKMNMATNFFNALGIDMKEKKQLGEKNPSLEKNPPKDIL